MRGEYYLDEILVDMAQARPASGSLLVRSRRRNDEAEAGGGAGLDHGG